MKKRKTGFLTWLIAAALWLGGAFLIIAEFLPGALPAGNTIAMELTSLRGELAGSLSMTGTGEGYALLPAGAFAVFMGFLLIAYRRRKPYSLIFWAYLWWVFATVMAYMRVKAGVTDLWNIIALSPEKLNLMTVLLVLEAFLGLILMYVTGSLDQKWRARTELREESEAEASSEDPSSASSDRPMSMRQVRKDEKRKLKEERKREKVREAEALKREKAEAEEEEKRREEEEREERLSQKSLEKAEAKEDRKEAKRRAREEKRLARRKRRKDDGEDEDIGSPADTDYAVPGPARSMDEKLSFPEIADIPRLETLEHCEDLDKVTPDPQEQFRASFGLMNSLKEEEERREEKASEVLHEDGEDSFRIEPERRETGRREDTERFRSGSMLEATLESIREVNTDVDRTKLDIGPIIGLDDDEPAEAPHRPVTGSIAPSTLSKDHPRYKMFESLQRPPREDNSRYGTPTTTTGAPSRDPGEDEHFAPSNLSKDHPRYKLFESLRRDNPSATNVSHMPGMPFRAEETPVVPPTPYESTFVRERDQQESLSARLTREKIESISSDNPYLDQGRMPQPEPRREIPPVQNRIEASDTAPGYRQPPIQDRPESSAPAPGQQAPIQNWPQNGQYQQDMGWQQAPQQTPYQGQAYQQMPQQGYPQQGQYQQGQYQQGQYQQGQYRQPQPYYQQTPVQTAPVQQPPVQQAPAWNEPAAPGRSEEPAFDPPAEDPMSSWQPPVMDAPQPGPSPQQKGPMRAEDIPSMDEKHKGKYDDSPEPTKEQENEFYYSIGISGLSSQDSGMFGVRQREMMSYTPPGKDILVDYPTADREIDYLTRERGEAITSCFEKFKIHVTLDNIIKGPTVTMYEIKLGEGIPVSKVKNHNEDIMYALGIRSVRILAPVPGKQAIGIEVPNTRRATIGFKDMLYAFEADASSKKMAVPMILGRTVTGEPVSIDVAKTPHLLIAGSTGSGKSVGINSLIATILYNKSPRDVRLIMVDPKVVELKIYNGIPHLLTPVITEAKKVKAVLAWLTEEMDRRYEMLSRYNVRNIVAFNDKLREKKIVAERLPYIVLIMDEYADLMTTIGKDIEYYVGRLTAMARAVGIHLVLATQRPDADVVTGIIKANIPSRIAFAVGSGVNSRIILDEQGAEQLLGKGDLLYKTPSSIETTRIQGAFLSDGEVEDIVEQVKRNGEPDYLDESIFEDPEEESPDDDEGWEYDIDPDEGEYEQAKSIVYERKSASASYLQRRMKIGYNKAARFVERMEEEGIIGPPNGSKPRELIKML